MYDTASKGLKIMFISLVASFVFAIMGILKGPLTTVADIGNIIATFVNIFGIYLISQDIEQTRYAAFLQLGVFVCQLAGKAPILGFFAAYAEAILSAIVTYLVCKYVAEAVYNYGAINTAVIGDYVWKAQVAILLASIIGIIFPLALIVSLIASFIVAVAYPVFIFKSGQILADA